MTFLGNLATSLPQTKRTKEMKELARQAREAKAREAACRLGLLDFCRRCKQTRHSLQGVPKCTVSGGLYHPGESVWVSLGPGQSREYTGQVVCQYSCCGAESAGSGCAVISSDHDFERVEK